MKLKERLVLGFSITAVLFTLVVVVDLQMDLGMSGHHLVPSHGRVKFGDGGVDGPGSAYNSFRKRFLQRSNNSSREISSGGGVTTSNTVPASQNGSGLGADGHNVAPTATAQREPHDDFSDLLDYVLNNGADVDVRGKASEGASSKSRNPTLGELTDTPAR
jgi:hypothetical protein